MDNSANSVRLAQSASALGAAILGFGLGSKWGSVVARYAIWIILVGAVLHIAGMYVMQMKNKTKSADTIAKLLWVSAWICLIALIGILIYLILQNK